MWNVPEKTHEGEAELEAKWVYAVVSRPELVWQIKTIARGVWMYVTKYIYVLPHCNIPCEVEWNKERIMQILNEIIN